LLQKIVAGYRPTFCLDVWLSRRYRVL